MKYSFLFCCLFLFYSCANSAKDTQVRIRIEEIKSLHVGDSWIYEEEYIDNDAIGRYNSFVKIERSSEYEDSKSFNVYFTYGDRDNIHLYSFTINNKNKIVKIIY